MFGLFRSVRHLVRLVGIALTLARHDALFPLEPVGPARCAVAARDAALLRRRGGRRRARASGWPRRFSELGPSFIKLGQMLATRADLLGDEIAADLALLQDRLPPFPGERGAGA